MKASSMHMYLYICLTVFHLANKIDVLANQVDMTLFKLYIFPRILYESKKQNPNYTYIPLTH